MDGSKSVEPKINGRPECPPNFRTFCTTDFQKRFLRVLQYVNLNSRLLSVSLRLITVKQERVESQSSNFDETAAVPFWLIAWASSTDHEEGNTGFHAGLGATPAPFQRL
jgi:hypothetical protein